MSLVEESYVQHLLNQCEAYSIRQEREAKESLSRRLDEVFGIFSKNLRHTFSLFSLDLIVRFAEIAVEIPEKFEYSQKVVDFFFQRVSSPSQFYIRALLVKAKVICYQGHHLNEKGETIVGTLKEAIGQIVKALDLIAGPPLDPKSKDAKVDGKEGRGKYGFLVYNASTCLYKITRFMLKQGWQRNFTDIYERIFKLLDEMEEPDHNWKCRFSLILFQCLYDSDRKPDAFKVLDTLWERTKGKPCDFQDSLFRLRVHLSKENPAIAAVVKKDIEGPDPQSWKILEILQRMKAGGIPEAQIQKQLMTIVNQISLNVMSTSETVGSVISPLLQERLAEAGRVALRYGIISIANAITNFLTKARQPSQKAMVLNQYNKAELLIKKKGEFVDKKTGMTMSVLQIKQLEVECRKEALKILEKVMNINRKLDNPELIYEGAVLVWNVSLPFMTPEYRETVSKVLQITASLLEQIDNVDHDLRTKIHLQLTLIHFPNERMFAEAEAHTYKALKLDASLPTAKLLHKFEPQEDSSLYYRPYQRYLDDFKRKILLKKMQIENPSDLDIVTMDIWNVTEQKSETTKMDILQKCLRTLINSEDLPFTNNDPLLVEEEVKQRKVQYQREMVLRHKRRKMLAGEIAELAFEWELNQFSKKACQFALTDTWDCKNAVELVILQAKCSYFLAQIKIDQLTQDNFETIFQDPVRINEDSEEAKPTEDKLRDVAKKKDEVLQCFKRGLERAVSAQQYYLIFNGAIYLWNNFLQVLRSSSNDSRLKAELNPLLRDFFEAMRNSLKQIETRGIVYYDLDAKIQIFANIGLIYARLLENLKQNEQVAKICEDLLLTSLSPNTRKLINGIKARISTSKAPVKADPKKGAPPSQKSGFNDTFIFEVVSQLQAIQNFNSPAERESGILKCFESLETWKPKENDETELELHAELWVRLARQAINEDNSKLLKYALRCVEQGLSLLTNEGAIVPSNRLRWYSLAQFLYSQALVKLVNPQTQETASIESLLFAGIQRAVQAASKGHRCHIGSLVLDAAKQIWNICAKLQDSHRNRTKLLKPVQSVLGYLAEIKQETEADLILLLAQVYFRGALQAGEYRSGEETADMVLRMVPKGVQKSIWQAKMIFMSKQGKNELQAMSNMKEADPSLQAKLWVKLARIATQPAKQQSAYHKAIQILRKDNSVEVVEVFIEYAEWQLRVGKEPIDKIIETLITASDQLIEIECSDDDDDQDEENPAEDAGTIFSRSTRGKKSQLSKSMKSRESKTKKAITIKGATTNKSKQSGVSRMNRSGKATKTIKSKNPKSIFSQREQQPNPDSLNGLHYERLFRIHTILGLLAIDSNARIQFALDARKFILRLLEFSICTFNEMQQNAAKFSEKEENSAFKRMKMPHTVGEWVKFELPKEFLEKIPKLEHYNFIGLYLFDKPQLTFTYLTHLIRIFQTYGLTLQAIPLHFFANFLAEHILLHNQLAVLAQLRLKYALSCVSHPDESSMKLSLETLTLDPGHRKEQLSRSKALKSSQQEEERFQEGQNSGNVVKSIRNYECWLQIGSILLKVGEIYAAKQYLQAALENAQLMKHFEVVGQAHIFLAEIKFYEGQQQEAVEHAVQATKSCKSSRNWETVVIITSRLLLSSNKLEDLRKFLKKIISTLGQLLENKSEVRERFAYQVDTLQIRNIMTTIEFTLLYAAFLDMLQQPDNSDCIEAFQSALEQLQKRLRVAFQRHILSVRHYQTALKYFQAIFDYFECGGKRADRINAKIFQDMQVMMRQLQHSILQILKYATIQHPDDYHFNQISSIHRRARFLLVKSCFISHSLGLSQPVVAATQLEEPQDPIIQSYLEELTQQLYKKNTPLQNTLTPIELAISVLENIQTNIPPDSVLRGRWLAEYAYAQTLRAVDKNQLRDLWTPFSETTSDMNKQFAMLSLQATQQFTQQGEPRLQSIEQEQQCFEYLQRGCLATMENRGARMGQHYFQYLCKYQHAVYSTSVLDLLRSKIDRSNRLVSGLRLQEGVTLSKASSQQIYSKDKLFLSVTSFPSFKECLSLMPRNSIYAVLQFDRSRQNLYFSCIVNDREEEQKTIVSRKEPVSARQLRAYVQLKLNMNKCKKNMVSTPFEDINRQKETILENESVLRSLMSQFKELSRWWSDLLGAILKRPKVATMSEVSKDKKGGKDQKKKGGKDQIGAYESPLGATPAGIESITFLLDQFLYALPFEELDSFANVPAVSRDCSLFYLTRKLQEVSFQPEMNNSSGFGLEKGKYFAYDFKDPQLNFKTILTDITKDSPSLKMDGVDSLTRFPSLGDYQRCLAEHGFIQVYGSLDWLNHMKFGCLSEYVGMSKAKLFLIFDQLNLRKSLLNKFLQLNTESEQTGLEEEEFVLATVCNLLNVTLVKNRWGGEAGVVASKIKGVYKSLASGHYVGAATRNAQKSELLLFNRLMLVVNGPPILRM